MRGKHQKTFRWTRLVCNSKGGKPTFVNWLFLPTLFISITVSSQSSQCWGWELVFLGGWDFNIVVGITLSNCSHNYVIILKLKCFIYWTGYQNISSVYENIQFWYPSLDYKTSIRYKHQNTARWTQLVCNRKVGKPNFENQLFLVNLVISGTVPIHSRECLGR